MTSSQDIYRTFCKQCPDLPLFHQAWWLDITCGEKGWDVVLDIAENKHINGVWPYYSKKIMRKLFYVEPLFTPYLSPLVFFPKNVHKQNKKYSFEDKVLGRMASKLHKKAIKRIRFTPSNLNWFSLFKNGWRSHLKHTYILENIKYLDDIRSAYKSSVRNDIKKAKPRISVKEDKDAKTLIALHQSSLGRKGKESTHHIALINRFTLACIDRQCGFILSAYDENEVSIASCFVAFDRNSAYLLLLGLDKGQKIQGAVQMIIDESIARASQYVNRFDFEGSMISEVEPVFRSFGGKRIPVLEVTWAPKWAKLLFILLDKNSW